jgi:5,5'-dehydrodivanillate O-demethylase
MYHRGFFNDDADRYGPALELVKDLHRRIEEFETARAEASEGADANAG